MTLLYLICNFRPLHHIPQLRLHHPLTQKSDPECDLTKIMIVSLSANTPLKGPRLIESNNNLLFEREWEKRESVPLRSPRLSFPPCTKFIFIEVARKCCLGRNAAAMLKGSGPLERRERERERRVGRASVGSSRTRRTERRAGRRRFNEEKAV